MIFMETLYLNAVIINMKYEFLTQCLISIDNKQDFNLIADLFSVDLFTYDIFSENSTLEFSVFSNNFKEQFLTLENTISSETFSFVLSIISLSQQNNVYQYIFEYTA